MTERVGLEVDTLTIPIPMQLQRRGGRKLIMTPEGAAMPTTKPRRDETLIKALVRAHRWRRKIESGQSKSITDLAEQEGVTDAYVCRLLPLTCVAPDIVEAILDADSRTGCAWLRCWGTGRLPGRSSERTGTSAIDTNLLKKVGVPQLIAEGGREGLAMTEPATAIWLTAGPGPDPQSLCVVWDCRNHLQSAERSGEASTSVATIPPAESSL
jgi:hypothetical protein